MQITDHALIKEASKIPVSPPNAILSFSPVVLPCKDRTVDLQLRVTAPATSNSALPIILLSHGHGRSNYLSSQEGYAPLAEFWAGHGFVVVQPTHLSSKSLNISLTPENYRELFLDSRAADMSRILDRLDEVEAAVPFLAAGGLDRARVAVAGHSLGGATACAILGMTNADPREGAGAAARSLADPRVRAGVVLGGTGAGGADNLSENGRGMVPFYGPDFGPMRTPALVVWGDQDVSPHLTSRGADWHLDPYTLAPGPKAAFCVRGGHHGFGGISGWDAGETLDEDPERLAAVQRMTWAYLRSQLYEGDSAWEQACKALEGLPHIGSVESKI